MLIALQKMSHERSYKFVQNGGNYAHEQDSNSFFCMNLGDYKQLANLFVGEIYVAN